MEISLRGIYDGETVDEESLLSRMRYQRDHLLKESDWTQVADVPVDKQAWATYRQQLRDFPTTWVPVEVVVFPDTPA